MRINRSNITIILLVMIVIVSITFNLLSTGVIELSQFRTLDSPQQQYTELAISYNSTLTQQAVTTDIAATRSAIAYDTTQTQSAIFYRATDISITQTSEAIAYSQTETAISRTTEAIYFISTATQESHSTQTAIQQTENAVTPTPFPTLGSDTIGQIWILNNSDDAYLIDSNRNTIEINNGHEISEDYLIVSNQSEIVLNLAGSSYIYIQPGGIVILNNISNMREPLSITYIEGEVHVVPGQWENVLINGDDLGGIQISNP